jgi:D-alanyl-D-alanine carboxypeptidase (penicillin-binding protein 5/6)
LGWWRKWRLLVTTALIVACVDALLPAAPASAAHRVRRRATHRVRKPVPLYRGAVLEDADTGAVLYELNPDMQWPPASMAKMMLLLVATEQIKAGRVSINAPVLISERAATTGGTRLGLREGEVFPLRELMKAALIKSANDAAVAVAEKIAGSTEACVRMMNQRARSLGLTHTAYNTVDGLPPRPAHDVDVTDAYDLATLGRTLIKNTDLLQWSGQEQALFDNGEAILHNTNHLIGHFEGCDGIKTGFTYQAGFNLTATAKRGDMRLIAVVLGAPSNRERFRQAARLLEWGFDNFTRVAVVKRGEPLLVHVRVAEGPLIQPIAADEVKLVVPKNKIQDLKVEYDVPKSVSGPLAVGAPLGQVIVRDDTRILTKVNALSPVSVGNTVQVNNAMPAETAGTGNAIQINNGVPSYQGAVAVCCINQPQVTR